MGTDLVNGPKQKLFLFFTRGGCVTCLRVCLGAGLLPQSYQYPNFLEGADRVCGQMRADKEGPFIGINKSGRVWRKMPESDARSVVSRMYTPGPTIYAQGANKVKAGLV